MKTSIALNLFFSKHPTFDERIKLKVMSATYRSGSAVGVILLVLLSFSTFASHNVVNKMSSGFEAVRKDHSGEEPKTAKKRKSADKRKISATETGVNKRIAAAEVHYSYFRNIPAPEHIKTGNKKRQRR